MSFTSLASDAQRAAQIEELLRSRPMPGFMSAPDASGFAQPSATPLDMRVAPGAYAAPEVGRRPAPAGAAPAPDVAPAPREIAPVAPVQVADPFRLNDPGLGPVRGRQEGDLFRYDANDPRERNPYLYRDGNVWRSAQQQGTMGPNGFTPGFVNNGVGGQRVWAADPASYLIALQQNAGANGANPEATMTALLGTLDRGAGRSLQAGTTAQQTNAQTGVANLNARTTTSEGAANRQSTERVAGMQLQGQAENAQRQMIGNLIAAGVQNPAALTPAFMGAIAPMMQQMFPGGMGAGPGAGAAGTPAAPAGGQAPAAGGPARPAAPAAPGAPAAAAPAGGPAGAAAGPAGAFAGLAQLGANQQFVAGLRPAFGIGADGAIPAGHQITPQMAIQLLDRMGGSTPEQQRAVADAIAARQLGDPAAVRQALLQATAMSHYRAAPPQAPSSTRGNRPFGFGIGAAIGGDNGYEPTQAPLSIPDYAVNGGNGELFRLRSNQNVLGVVGSHLLHGGNPYNQVVDPAGNAYPLDRQWWGQGLDSTPAATFRNRAGYGASLLQLLGAPPAPARRQ